MADDDNGPRWRGMIEQQVRYLERRSELRETRDQQLAEVLTHLRGEINLRFESVSARMDQINRKLAFIAGISAGGGGLIGGIVARYFF